MRNSLRNLLEEVGKDTSKHRKSEEHITGLICGFEQQSEKETFLTYQIRFIRKYVKELIISLPKNYEIQDSSLKNEIKDLNVKIIERKEDEQPYSSTVFDQLIQKSLNNRVLFLPYDFEISRIKIEKIISNNYSLISYLGVLGNFFPYFGVIDKWNNRFNLQLIRFCQKKNLDDFYRISSNLTFFKLIKQDCILRKSLVSDDLLKTIQSQDIDSFFPLKIQYPSDEQALVKLIALMHILQKELDEKKEITSSFKVQQLLTLGHRFASFGHNYLAFQAHLFLLLRSNTEIKFPLDWSIEKVSENSRRLLLEESKIYAERGLERLRFVCLNDLISLNLAKEQDREWILKEIPKIRNDLQKDNIEYYYQQD
ncbi:MAG: hypothetical protein GOP50_02915 [Candidatus Heimdallarchaeota archaeon]|nr:hypothetical protein [Candidatus Heimdallarchaeota archaeon]